MAMPRVHELLPARERRAFQEHMDAVAKRVATRIPEELVYPYGAISYLLKKRSENDPRKPEWPFPIAKFPATPTRKVRIPGLDHLDVFVKDESYNPISNTHKDRKSWEWALAQYRMIDEMVRTGKARDLPRLSIISSGNAAPSLGRTNALFGLPPVHALVEEDVPERKIARLKESNVRVFTTDLSKKALDSDEILALTRNKNGVDLTLGKFAKDNTKFYDWFSYEVLNHKPDYVLVPYGSGELYDNLVHTYRSEMENGKSDPRLMTRKRWLHGMNIIGITAEMGSPADKLSAPHLPGSSLAEVRSTKANVISQNVRAGFLGEHSGIHTVQDSDLYRAKQIADKIGLRAEHSALAGLAWLLRNGHAIKPGSRIVIVSTGKGISED